MESNLVVRTLDREPLNLNLNAGMSIYDILVEGNVPEHIYLNMQVFNHGSIIKDWDYITKPGDKLTIYVVPTGGGGGIGGVVAAIATVVVVAAAVAVTGGAAAGVLGAGFAAGTTGAAVLGAGVAVLGMMAVSALVPPPALNVGTYGNYAAVSATPVAADGAAPGRAIADVQGEASTYSITGQSNAASPYGIVPVIYGKHKFYPKIATTPHIENFGQTSIISALYDFGIGDVDLEDILIGDTPYANFGAEIIIHKNTKKPELKYLNKRVSYESFAYVLNDPKSITIRTKPGTTAAMVDIQFPNGLCQFNKYTGDREGRGVSFNVTWKSVNGIHSGRANKWAGNASNGNVHASTAQPFVTNAYMDFPEKGQYEITITRTTGGTLDDRVRDEATVASLKSYAPGVLLNLDDHHTFIEMRIEASEKISGVVSNLNAIAYRKLRWHDGTSWQTPKRTSNPAWIVCDILTGESNVRPLDDDQIDMVSFNDLAAVCDEEVNTVVNGLHILGPRFEANMIVDDDATVQQMCNSLLSNCRAQLMVTQNGKWGVLIDREQPTVRQVFTPENSWNFSGNRYFTEYPDAFRVNFVNPELGWQKDECVVFNDNYDIDTARKYETLDTIGVTSYAQAWRFGRYMMAQAIWRSEMFSLTVDVENLAVQRGERVQVATDVAGVGGIAARIVEVWGDHRIRISQKISAQYNAYTIRYSDGTIKKGVIDFIVDTDSFDIDTTAGLQGDELIVIGMSERVVADYIVFEVAPGADLTADLTLIPYAPKIFYVDNEEIPIWYPQWGHDIDFTDLEVTNLTVDQKIYYPNRYPILHIAFDWEEVSAPELVLRYQIYIKRTGQPDEFLAYAFDTRFTHVIDILNDPLHMEPCTYEIYPISKTGVWGTPGRVDVVPIKDTQKPIIPEYFNVNIQRETAQLFWSRTKEPDVMEYEIRYTSELTAPQWNASQFLASMPWTSTTFSVGARTGTYMIRAIDSSGNKSDVAFQRTTVESLENVENIHDIDDSLTGWKGSKTGLVQYGRYPYKKGLTQELWSQGDWGSVWPESDYFFENTIDLTDIYEVRVASKIEARGESYYDLMVNWVPSLADVPFMARATADQWDTWLEYRTIEVIKYMAEWQDLTYAEVPDLIGGGTPWSEWRSILVGDVTAKIIQFRIQARSRDPFVKVVLTDGSVEIDAMDRLISMDDIRIPVGGLDINFPQAFMFDTYALAVTIDGNNKPVVAKVSNKDRTGVYVELFNTLTNDSISGKIDIMARGQGKERAAII